MTLGTGALFYGFLLLRVPLDAHAQVVPIDATPAYHEGRWWLFYTGGPDRTARMAAIGDQWRSNFTDFSDKVYEHIIKKISCQGGAEGEMANLILENLRVCNFFKECMFVVYS